MSGYVYFVMSENFDYFKIGWSANPHKRTKQIQVSCPFRVSLVARFESERNAEIEMQQRFSESQSHGEWFRVEENLLDLFSTCPETWFGKKHEKAKPRLLHWIQGRINRTKQEQELRSFISEYGQERIEKVVKNNLLPQFTSQIPF